MKILTWNIQATKGCDDVFDMKRIVDRIKKLGDWDVICLQEIAKNIPDLNGDDQPVLLAGLFPDYEAVWGPGFSASDGGRGRCEFGNMTLVKAPLFRNSRVHSLPSPQVNVLQMPRTMVEAVVEISGKCVAIYNAHLAFHSNEERVGQIQAITELRDQLVSKSEAPEVTNSWGPYTYVNNCSSVILCGDLNVDSDDAVFKDYIEGRSWVDCWTSQSALTDKNTRSPTCGCFDHVQWPQGAHIRDYFLATENIANKTVRVEVDVTTNASDHQPVYMEINL